MKIKSTISENQMIVKLDGRLDSATAPELERAIATRMDGITELTFDFTDLRYISSAGLRVLLTYSKKMKEAQGVLVIQSPNEMAMDAFEATGFLDILEIRQQ